MNFRRAVPWRRARWKEWGLPLLGTCALLSPSAPPAAQNPVGYSRSYVPESITSTTGNHLNYYGGPVLSNVKIVMVLYGDGSYMGNVTGDASPTMQDFYRSIVDSVYMDWLDEYRTDITTANGTAGTNQRIGRGSFVGKYTITPSAAHFSSDVSTSDISAELVANIQSGKLPAPDKNTLYMVHVPDGHIPKGDFCAYHTFSSNSTYGNIYFGVMPDLDPGGALASTCGGGGMDRLTKAASHELVESVTDPVTHPATNLTSPPGWKDPNVPEGDGQEIADLCQKLTADFYHRDGTRYTVQQLWSNRYNGCVVPQQYFVGSAAGKDTASATGTPTSPFATIAYALGRVTADSSAGIYPKPKSFNEQPTLSGNRISVEVWGTGTATIGH